MKTNFHYDLHFISVAFHQIHATLYIDDINISPTTHLCKLEVLKIDEKLLILANCVSLPKSSQ